MPTQLGTKRVSRFGSLVTVAGLAVAGLLFGLGSPVHAQDCAALGSSDGVTAEAVAVCSVVPDDVLLDYLNPVNPGGCAEATSYELAVGDDSQLAVFPGGVVANYTAQLSATDAMADGQGQNFGTALDVLRSGEPIVGISLESDFGSRQFSESGRWWRRVCWETDSGSGLLRPGPVQGPFPEGPVVPLSELIAVAWAQVNPPPVPTVEHAGPVSLLQLPTWFWVSPAYWGQTYRGDASHGLVSVSVAAAPARWQLSAEGDVVLGCEGRGEIWTRGRDDRHGCTHTFVDAVPQNQVSLSLEVELDTFWGTSLDGYRIQPLPVIRRRVDQAHGVSEVVGLRSG